MLQEIVLYPALALGFWTFGILIMIPLKRSRARQEGLVTIDDFALGESANVPANVSLINRNYMNLLEMPVLFYAVCLMFYVTGSATMVSVVLCWVYTSIRIVHTLVHLGYNNVAHRRGVFAGSNVLLLVLWVIMTNNIV